MSFSYLTFPSTARRWVLSGCTLLAVAAQAPTTAPPPPLLDDFDRADNITVGAGGREPESRAGAGAALVSNQLTLSSGVLGKDFVARDMSARDSPVLRRHTNQLTWLFNRQPSRPNPAGFASNHYGVAFVLTASAADFPAAVTSGYAVVYGLAGPPDSWKLLRFTGGLNVNGPGNLKTLVWLDGPYSRVAELLTRSLECWLAEAGPWNQRSVNYVCWTMALQKRTVCWVCRECLNSPENVNFWVCFKLPFFGVLVKSAASKA